MWNETENFGAKINFKISESDINVVFEERKVIHPSISSMNIFSDQKAMVSDKFVEKLKLNFTTFRDFIFFSVKLNSVFLYK